MNKIQALSRPSAKNIKTLKAFIITSELLTKMQLATFLLHSFEHLALINFDPRSR